MSNKGIVVLFLDRLYVFAIFQKTRKLTRPLISAPPYSTHALTVLKIRGYKQSVLYKTRQCVFNITMRRVIVSIVVVEEQRMLHIVSVSL